jgi:hypothetical protein
MAGKVFRDKVKQSSKLREPDPNLLERVLFTDEEIALAVIDFTQRSEVGILDAEAS